MHGVHGRRRAGPGETFWQFRPFASGEPANRIDWRRSARGAQAFVREREWEGAQTVWLWFDRSATMDFRSELSGQSKLDRAAVLTLALADLAVRGSERVGLMGLTRPLAARNIIDRFAQALAAPGVLQNPAPEPLPPLTALGTRAKIVLIGDFLVAPAEIEARFAALAGEGVEGHVLMIADPIEETFPFAGAVDFLDVGGAPKWRAPRAENLKAPYQARLASQRAAVKDAARVCGWDFALHRTDASAAGALLALYARLEQAAA